MPGDNALDFRRPAGPNHVAASIRQIGSAECPLDFICPRVCVDTGLLSKPSLQSELVPFGNLHRRRISISQVHFRIPRIKFASKGFFSVVFRRVPTRKPFL
jgi:hypothetical protein